jgi:hypothetical protein
MTHDPTLRAGDDDRERVAAVLREAYAEGRLPADEFEARLQATYDAATIGDLLPLVKDLPDRAGLLAELRPASVPATPAVPPSRQSSTSRLGVGAWALPVLVLVLLLVVVTRGGALRLWPVWLVTGAAVAALVLGRTGNNRG